MNCKSLELVKSPLLLDLLGYGLMVIAKHMSAVRTTTTHISVSVSAVFVGHFTELI
jgi:hypothetical protein